VGQVPERDGPRCVLVGDGCARPGGEAGEVEDVILDGVVEDGGEERRLVNAR